MHILATEFSQIAAVPAVTLLNPAPSSTLTSPWLRPRLEGYRTAERGKAYDARLADTAQVQFTVRLPAGAGDRLNNYQVLLTVEQAPLLGQDPSATFPPTTTDVSGFFALEGRIAVTVALYGVCRAKLQLIRRVNPPGVPATVPLFTLVQVLAEERGIDVETVLHDRGES